MLNVARLAPGQERESNPGRIQYKGRAPVEKEVGARLEDAPVIIRRGNLSCMLHVPFALEPSEVAVRALGLPQDRNLDRELPGIPADLRCVFIRLKKDGQHLKDSGDCL